jgi:hypothetical protein
MPNRSMCDGLCEFLCFLYDSVINLIANDESNNTQF